MSIKGLIQRTFSPTTLGEAFTELLNYQAANTSKDSRQNYERRLSSFVEPLANVPISQLDPKQADEWVNKGWGRDLATATMAGYVQAIKRLDAFIQERHPHEYRPFAAHLKKPKWKPEAGAKLPDEADVQKMIAKATQWLHSDSTARVRDACIFFWVLETGMRRIECTRLTVAHVTQPPKQVRDKEGELHTVYETLRFQGKTGMQTVDYSERMQRIIEHWLALRTEMNPKTDALFIGTGNKNHKPTCRCRVSKRS